MSVRIATLPFVFLVLSGNVAHAQCILANPSFEIAGSGGASFGGWNQFGPVERSPLATHGFASARIEGPDAGSWSVAGVWQRLDCAPGTAWRASVRAWQSTERPLDGGARALLNIEWRDADEGLIGYESHVVLDAASASDEVVDLGVTSGPAPASTASVRLLLGVLQGPGDARPEVWFDEARLEAQTVPSIEDLQWNDFPGGRVVEFAGRSWRVKGPGFYGPGGNVFCDTADCVWVDGDGALHLTITRGGSTWRSTEVALVDSLGYGDYVFTTRGALDALHPRAVLGLFLWEYARCYELANGWWNPYNEIDVEFGRWGDPANDIGQFVAQPYDHPGNIHRFAASFGADEVASHAFRWLPDRVEYRSWRGGAQDESAATTIASWTYTGPHIPRPERPRVHLNLWQFDGPLGTTQEVVLENFTFVPRCPGPNCDDEPTSVATITTPTNLRGARPNPFNPRTTITFVLDRDEDVRLHVFDVAGRHVRTLLAGRRGAGEHHAIWDGTDDAGRAVASGVYLYQLRAGAAVQSRRMALVR